MYRSTFDDGIRFEPFSAQNLCFMHKIPFDINYMREIRSESYLNLFVVMLMVCTKINCNARYKNIWPKYTYTHEPYFNCWDYPAYISHFRCMHNEKQPSSKFVAMGSWQFFFHFVSSLFLIYSSCAPFYLLPSCTHRYDREAFFWSVCVCVYLLKVTNSQICEFIYNVCIEYNIGMNSHPTFHFLHGQ